MVLIIIGVVLTYILLCFVTYNCLIKVFTKKVIEKDDETILLSIMSCIFWPVLVFLLICYLIVIFLTKYAERVSEAIAKYIKENM